ncbi:MAG TPA: Rieske (2Fe-2S) protein [Kofleriaceae bacterium]|nr:Rieske (2Fe-2S) protein [Kofleriaceae bacterium]
MSCSTCSRRAILQGLGAAAAAALAGCGTELPGSGGGIDGGELDAGATGDAARVGSGDAPIASCGDDMICLDLNDPANAALVDVGGAMKIEITSDTLIVVHSAQGTFATLSDVCTHMGCPVDYNASLVQLRCPCHGSQFALTGEVLVGPAQQPLKVYPTSYDTAKAVVTIAT